MVLPFLGLVLLDGFFLWGALLAAFIFAWVCVEKDEPIWVTVDVVVVGLLVAFFTNLHPIQWLQDSPAPLFFGSYLGSYNISYPWNILTYIVEYLACGTIWVFFKWSFRVYNIKNKFNAFKHDLKNEMFAKFGTAEAQKTKLYRGAGWLEESDEKAVFFNADKTLTTDGSAELLRRGASRLGELSLPIQISNYKSQLYMWWIVWPVSIISTCFTDLWRTIWDFVYNRLSGLLQKISDMSIKVP